MAEKPTVVMIKAWVQAWEAAQLGVPAGSDCQVQLQSDAADALISVRLGYALSVAEVDALGAYVKQCWQEQCPGSAHTLEVSCSIRAHGPTLPQHKPVPGVKNILAVTAAKGGVGKSTTAVNLALALQADGANVGLLDADVLGPSVPCMLGAEVQASAEVVEGRFVPRLYHGLQTQSIAFLLQGGAPAVWRGPMASKALQQLLWDTAWSELDYLILDLPPGTGDIPLTLTQRAPLTGGVFITTPQSVAALDVQKGMTMFQTLNVPLLGVVENMVGLQCPHCAEAIEVFPGHAGSALAQQAQVPLLAQLPINPALSAAMDAGKPLLLEQPATSIMAAHYRQLARRIAAAVTRQPRRYQGMPNVVVHER